jgi:cell division control protein 6
MSRYEDIFEETASKNSVFRDKSALDPLAEPPELIPRPEQEQRIATLLQVVQDNYIPTSVSVYGPPRTGKTVLTRRLCE